MALRAGYKGFKKLAGGLKLIRPGTIGIKTRSGSPIVASDEGLSLNIDGSLALLVDPQAETAALALGNVFKRLSGEGSDLIVAANSFTNVDVTIPTGYTILNAQIMVTGAGSSANSFTSLVTGSVPGRFCVGNKDTSDHNWNYTYEIILINSVYVGDYSSRTLNSAVTIEPEEPVTVKKTTRKKSTATAETEKEGE